MVDAQGAGVREHVVHHLTVDAVTGGFQVLRAERRLPPVLAELVVEVRRGADRHAVGESFGTPPHVGAEGVHAHRHVLHQTERHAGVLGGLLRGGHLFVGDPLQPALEFEHVMVVTHQSRHGRRVLVGAEEPRVLLPRRAPHLERQAPGGEGVQVRPRRALELGEGRLALPGARRGENQPQRLTFGVPRGVDVHRLGAVVGLGHRGVQRLDLRAGRVVKRRVFGDVLRPDIGDVEESTRFRQVRRGLQRGHRGAGVDRVDEHEVGVRLLTGVGGQPLQVAVVADTPGIGRPHGVHLRHPPPTLPLTHRFGQFDAGRGDDDRGATLHAADLHVERVVSDRQVVRQREFQLFAEVGVLVHAQVRAQVAGVGGSVLQRQCQRHQRVRRAAQRHVVRPAGDGQHGRRHQLFALATFGFQQRLADSRGIRGVHAQRRQHGDEHLVADFNVGSELVDVRRRDAARLGQADERTLEARRAFLPLGGLRLILSFIAISHRFSPFLQ